MSEINWQKSSYSTQGDGNSCVELAALGPGAIALRESDEPGTVMTTTPAKLRPLLDAIKAGEFDHLAG
ncbi:DUF397 domain-containing protein [Streptomyces sp. NBRC 110028]|uniref:DUF397 domain-containing protein n=1 Tax=Streptomyces sp. NBRC 110028 TaxID=1621260 RepID=UPI0006E1586A|nr:DUF397 domain-containing protein [Streptomyces sp. NBRC 110028]